MAGCSTKDYFGKLPDNEILEFQLEGQIGVARFNDSRDTIFITVSKSIYISKLTHLSATIIEVSDYATVSPQIGKMEDFTNPVMYTVTAEDNSKRQYYVLVQSRGGDDDGGNNGDGQGNGNEDEDDSGDDVTGIQLYNSNFDFWFDVTYSAKKCKEIGENNSDGTWGSGNKGAASILKADQLPTKPFDLGNGNYAAELTTKDMGSMAGSFIAGYKGIAAGSIFVGTFVYNSMTDAHPVFGIPYTELPKSFQVDYMYSPVKGLLNGKRKAIDGEDALDMYLVLERREGETVKRLGVGWYRSFDAQDDWKTQNVKIKYARGGQPPLDLDDYQTRVLKYGVDGNINETNPENMPVVNWGDIDKEEPTHIFVVFTSSYQGDYFIGAPGSKLIVDNFKLIY